MRRLIIAALCHFKRVTIERVASAKIFTEVQDCLTTKDLSAFEEQAGTRSTKEKDQARDFALRPGECGGGSAYYIPRGDIAHQITAFHRSSSSTLRVLGALRGKFSLACVPCETEPEAIIHSCLPPACHSDADRRRHRQAKRQGAKKLITALLLLVGMCVSGLAQSSLQVMLDFFPNPNHVPLIVAVTQGFFSDEGIDVEIVVPANPSDPIKLVAAGAVDLALTPQINLLIARDADLPVIAVGSLVGSPLGGLLGLEENGISRLSDLRGRRIGYSLAPLEPILWRTMLASVGVEPGEYELINVGFNTVLSLLSGQVDAIGAFRNFEVPQVGLAGRKPIFFPEEEYGVPNTEEILIAANADTLTNNAIEMRAFLAGLARGIAFTVDHPEEAYQAFIASYPDLDDDLNRRVYEITLPLFSKGARLGTESEWEALQSYLFENSLIKSKLELAALYTQAYLPGKKE